jgi:hypothetical protein
MGLVDALGQHLGLLVLTAIAIGLTVYLLWVMAHPERF